MMLHHLDRTLDEIDGPPWPPAPPNATSLATKVHALRRRPLGSLAPADLRTLISQDVALPHVLPLAVDLLVEDPLLDACFYEGDLLHAAVTRPATAWLLFPDLAVRLATVVAPLPATPERAEFLATHAGTDHRNPAG
ncbi:contact-dependent growth inhibition system immunity protein [Streptomyces sp. NPDC059990]|uniref:contact-dependent growth inhibition system immunity protein n=1 Tax=Streptomyces sp. NPDC059990 TaxID=3347027 RepID=UPI0036B4D231